MGRKFKVRLTEQEFGELLAKSLIDKTFRWIKPDEIKKILSSEDTGKTDSSKVRYQLLVVQELENLQKVNLNKSEGFNAYKEIAR
jgi:hypothetical protein